MVQQRKWGTGIEGEVNASFDKALALAYFEFRASLRRAVQQELSKNALSQLDAPTTSLSYHGRRVTNFGFEVPSRYALISHLRRRPQKFSRREHCQNAFTFSIHPPDNYLFTSMKAHHVG